SPYRMDVPRSRRGRDHGEGQARQPTSASVTATSRDLLPLASLVLAVASVAAASEAPKAEDKVCEAIFHQDADVFGGSNLFLLRSGTIWLKTIDPNYGQVGYTDRRYTVVATQDERLALSSVVMKAGFFKLKSAKRRPIPEELKTRITVRRCDG